MATIWSNGFSLLTGVSGRIGDIVVHQRNGRTILCNRPKKSSVPPTASQQKTRMLFREAAAYAKNVMQDADRKQAYAEKLQNVGRNLYTAIVTDYLKERKKVAAEQGNGNHQITK